MPPNQPLSPSEKELLRQWISSGARWGTSPISWQKGPSEGLAAKDWWSLQPIAPQEIPPVHRGDWCRNEIDQFILAKLESRGLSPAPPAEGDKLLRRLYFDMIGLPPILEEADGVVHERLLDLRVDMKEFAHKPTAYLDVVDRRLQSSTKRFRTFRMLKNS